MKIRTKLLLGIFFLFVEFLVITLYSAYSIYTLAKQSERIMRDNNLSIQYAENMQQAIDQINAHQIAILFNPSRASGKSELSGFYHKFEEYMRKESSNVSEPGERELLHSLTDEYEHYKLSVSELHAIKNRYDFYFQTVLPKYASLKSKIYQISEINLHSIVKKNEEVTRHERRSYVILTVIASLCFLLTLSFIFNFPGIITKPINQVSESLRSLSQGNYDIPLHFTSTDEFKEMENDIKAIAKRLQKYESSDRDAVLREKDQMGKTVDRLLEKLRTGHDRLMHMDIKRTLDDHLNTVREMINDLEQSKRSLERK